MVGVLHSAEAILRGQTTASPAEATSRRLPRLILLIVIFGMTYGSVMGTFSATSIERLPQIIYAAVKVPMMLLVTFFISLPNFFVLNTLLGLRRDFEQAIRALITTQAGLTIILASLSPFTALWYSSYGDYDSAILFNGVMFAVASVSSQVLLRRLYRPLIRQNPRHRVMLGLWLVIYIFVGIQMGWVLRPFIGSPYTETRFFREGAFSNAYVVVGELIWNVLKRVI